MQHSAPLSELVPPPTALGSLPLCEAQLVLALRCSVIARRGDHEPEPYVAARLGQDAVPYFALVEAAVGDAWPDNFALARPCCPMLTPDEHCFARMFRLAATAQRPEFERLLEEMIGGDAREFLYHRMRELAACLLK